MNLLPLFGRYQVALEGAVDKARGVRVLDAVEAAREKEERHKARRARKKAVVKQRKQPPPRTVTSPHPVYPLVQCPSTHVSLRPVFTSLNYDLRYLAQ
jgi:hypothetical protein